MAFLQVELLAVFDKILWITNFNLVMFFIKKISRCFQKKIKQQLKNILA